MKADEKYNQIIYKIENYVRTEPYKKKAEIMDRLIKETGYFSNQREFNAVFGFINGKLPQNYITLRQLMNAYKYMISFEKYEDVDMNHVMEMTCAADQPRFNRIFKEQFKTSPTKIFKNNQEERESLYKEPEYWGTFDNSMEEEEETMEQEMSYTSEKTMFGIDKEVYERIVEIQNLGAIYGCSDAESNAAYRFADEYSLPLTEAFEYVSQFIIPLDEVEEYFENALHDGKITAETDTVEKFYINEMWKDMKNKTVMHCYFDLGLDAKSSLSVYYRALEEQLDLSNVEKIYAFALAELPSCKSKEVFEMTDYYLQRNGDNEVDYNRFADYLDEAWEHGLWVQAYNDTHPTFNGIIDDTDWNQLDMLDREQYLLDAIDEDDDRREDWLYYRNPHEYSDDEYDKVNNDEDYGDF